MRFAGSVCNTSSTGVRNLCGVLTVSNVLLEPCTTLEAVACGTCVECWLYRMCYIGALCNTSSSGVRDLCGVLAVSNVFCWNRVQNFKQWRAEHVWSVDCIECVLLEPCTTLQAVACGTCVEC
jgi:hypothetical protein